jgi:nicotinamidase-related amidase
MTMAIINFIGSPRDILAMLQKNHSLLLCIDYQERLLPKIHMAEEITKNAIIMIRAAQVLGIPIMVTEQYPTGLGKTVKDIVKALGVYYKPIEKMTFNCFESQQFAERIEATKLREILIMGIESHICVLQTVLEAIRRKYHVYILEDTISSRSPENRRVAFDRMIGEGATPSCVEMAIYELLKVSGTGEFKEILKFVR